MIPAPPVIVKVVGSLAEIKAQAWDACANPEPSRSNPFVCHAFLKALEDAGTVGLKAGWIARHLILDDGEGGIAAAAPCYVKTHSQGEYVFDHGWAEAYGQAGGRYIPNCRSQYPSHPFQARAFWSSPARVPPPTSRF